MAQLEDDLVEQQRQLELLRKTLANVVDVATHRLHKDHVAAKLNAKVDAEVMEKRHEELLQVQREQLFEALANKVDACALEECRRELANIAQYGIADLERQQLQLAQSMLEDRVGVEDLRREHSRMLSNSQKDIEALIASLANKAESSALEEQREKVASMEDSTKKLEAAIAETSREQYSAVMSVKIDNEVMQTTINDALKRHWSALDRTREEVEQRFQDFQEKEEWLKQREEAANKMFSVWKERQDEELEKLLAKNVDFSLNEQQKFSFAEQQKMYEDVQMKLVEKADTVALERIQEGLQLEISQARQETSDMSCRLDRHLHYFDLARAQLIEIFRQQSELEASLGAKADKGSFESKQLQLETLCAKLEDIERRQDETRREFTRLQEQFFAALRSKSAVANVGNGLCLPKRIMEPPPSPRERFVCLKPSSARTKYRCEVSPALSARRKMGGN